MGWIDPLHGEGYQWWSGLGSCLMYFSAVVVFVRHHNCHVKGCWRTGHMYPGVGELRCKRHKP